MVKLILFFFLTAPLICFAQISINGKVIDAGSKKPVANASVFLSNATVGNKTNEEGEFQLKNVSPGQYDLVVSIIGYETYHYTLIANKDDVKLATIELIPKSIMLNEVVVKPDPDWARNFNVFKQEFLGSSPEAEQCKILNPDVVDVKFDAVNRKLIASSYDFVVIENKALGYRIKYLLNHFEKNYAENMLYYEGSVFFEELTGSTSQQKKWQKKRDNAYFGSLAHFLRSSLHNTTDIAGFQTLQLIKKPNPERLPEQLIKSKLIHFRNLLPGGQAIQDSLGKWGKQENMPKTISYLNKNPLNSFELIKLTNEKGIYAISYSDCLYVMYTKTHDTSRNPQSFQSPTAPNYPTTIINFAEKYVLFDDNGTVINPSSMIFEGYWGTSRVANMLPVNYEPIPIK